MSGNPRYEVSLYALVLKRNTGRGVLLGPLGETVRAVVEEYHTSRDKPDSPAAQMHRIKGEEA